MFSVHGAQGFYVNTKSGIQTRATQTPPSEGDYLHVLWWVLMQSVGFRVSNLWHVRLQRLDARVQLRWGRRQG